MVKLLLISLLFLAFLNANAQTPLNQKQIDLRLPASYLIKGSDHMLSGLLLTTAGCVLIGIGANNHEPLIYIGGGCAVLGFGFSISGIKKIGYAGRYIAY